LGVVYNDLRHAPWAEGFPARCFYLPGKVSADDWSVIPSQRPRSGPIRVGWAGSEAAWPGVKNVDMLEEACDVVGVEFVRQRREDDGVLDMEQMEAWYNSLDLYASANIEMSCTPVPVLEAMRCGVAVLTTRCGEVWPILRAVSPELVAHSPTVKDLSASLSLLKARGRQEIRDLGWQVRKQSDVVTWEAGAATRVTEVLAQWLDQQDQVELT
jgi:hypothetical protein